MQALFSEEMSPIWSGGVAFSYFPATSSQGQFGMVNISSDGSTVTVGDDYNRLVAQYSNATGPNDPSQASAGTTQYPTCPGQNSSFIASTTLPPTPNDTACACVVNTLSCQFTPQTSNTTGIVGTLLDEACGLLGQQGLNCNDIAGNGTTGTYGRLEFCDPASKLSFVMTEFYEATNRNAASCNFAGNATINQNAPSNTNNLNSAVSACLVNSAATFTPTTPATSSGGGSGSGGSGSSGGSSPKSSSAALSQATFLPNMKLAVLGMSVTLSIMVGTGIWTLA